MEKCSRQKVSIKFFLQSKTQTKMFGHQMENSGCQFFFSNQNKENVFGAAMAIFPFLNKIKYEHPDYLYIY